MDSPSRHEEAFPASQPAHCLALSQAIRLEASRHSRTLFGRYLRPEVIRCRKKAKGSFNSIYLLQVGESRVILKMRDVVDPRGWCSTTHEAQGLHAVAGYINSPKLLLASPPIATFPYEYVAIEHIWGHPSSPGLTTAESVARCIGRLHSMPLASGKIYPDGTSRGVLGAVADCVSLFSELTEKTALPIDLRKEVEIAMRTVLITPAATESTAPSLVPSHGDPVPCNFIIPFRSSELYLLDWETFALAPWTFDAWACLSPALNAWGWSRSLNPAEKMKFLETYCDTTGLSPGAAAAELNAANPSYSLRYCLWCLKRYTHLVSRPERSQQRLAKTFLSAASLAVRGVNAVLINAEAA